MPNQGVSMVALRFALVFRLIGRSLCNRKLRTVYCMKKAILNQKRWLSIMIGTFGCICMVQALFCAYIINNVSIDDIGSHLTINTISEINNAQKLLSISFLAFSLAGIFSIVAAIGIFINKSWGKNIWLSATPFIFVYKIMDIYINIHEWPEHIAVVILIIYSWIVLCSIPQKGKTTFL